MVRDVSTEVVTVGIVALEMGKPERQSEEKMAEARSRRPDVWAAGNTSYTQLGAF